MDAARDDEKSVQNLTQRILVLNFGAIFTTTMVLYFFLLLLSFVSYFDIFWQSFTHALFNLAAMPHYIHPLREEVEAIINEEGWSKASLDKMRKLDSFLKESQRYNASARASCLFFVYIP